VIVNKSESSERFHLHSSDGYEIFLLVQLFPTPSRRANMDMSYASFFRRKAAAAAEAVAKSAAEAAKNPGTETGIRLRMDMELWAHYDSARRATECHGL